MAGLVCLEPPSDAHKGAGGAQAGHEVRHPAVGLAEDFRAGGVVVRAPVAVVVVLVGIKIAFGFVCHDLARQPDRAIAAFERIALDDRCAIGLRQGLALLRDVGRHHQPNGVALGRADHRIANAGIAAGGVDQDPIVRQPAVLLSVLDYTKRCAVLDGTARVEPLGLGVQLHPWLAHQVAQVEERRVADLLQDRGGPVGPLGRDRPDNSLAACQYVW